MTVPHLICGMAHTSTLFHYPPRLELIFWPSWRCEQLDILVEGHFHIISDIASCLAFIWYKCQPWSLANHEHVQQYGACLNHNSISNLIKTPVRVRTRIASPQPTYTAAYLYLKKSIFTLNF